MKSITIATLLLFTAFTSNAQPYQKGVIRLADPSVLYDGGTYYLYGTGGADGFNVYTSSSLYTWRKGDSKALSKGDSFGTKGFWAPQVIKHQGNFIMAYTANEQIAIAQSHNPQGPFMQTKPQPITLSGKHIDPFIFRDTNGDFYLYFVRLQKGNRIFAARLKKDLTDIDSTTIKECLYAQGGWENTAGSSWPVAEGPTVIKLQNLYYLFYSANDFRNVNYAVGYATSTSPLGPFTKYQQNPILSRKQTGQNGSGHGDVLIAGDGHWYYIFHTHESANKVGERKTAIMQLSVSTGNPQKIAVVHNTFRYLEIDKPIERIPAN
ncbi:glycoside hydrolase family 43 protein [Mucilaginibacter sp. CSA2-8R]|uniref:glycoside hydrolase family 43 protein n=1 Tax=Mucilaginibacter sp. CSA2-8R TaxID=3141542 RepID=UPI00315DEA8E